MALTIRNMAPEAGDRPPLGATPPVDGFLPVDSEATPLVEALADAAGGLRVVPYRQDKAGSLLPGRAWKDEATTDEATIRRWGRIWAKGLIACVIPEGRVVLDLDYPERLDPGQVLPSGPTRIGGRGRQIWLAGEAPYMTKLPGDAGELLGPGHIAIMPTPGSKYAWADDRRPWDIDLAPVPAWAAVPLSEPESEEPVEDEAPMTSRNEILGLAGRMKEAGYGYETRLAELRARLRDGRIAESDPSRPWTEDDLKAIAKNPPTSPLPPPIPIRIATRAEAGEPNDLIPVRLSDIVRKEAEPLVLDRLDGNDSTVLFGDGGVGKGVVAAWWAARLTTLGDVVLVLDYEAHTQYEWRPRVEDFGGDMSRVWVLQPRKAIWKIENGLHDLVEFLRLTHNQARVWVFVDSIAYACVGVEVEKSSTAALYWSAIRTIAAPNLSLAHTTKADADSRHPFGTVYWSNGARVTIGLSRKGEALDSPRILKNKKTNQRAPFPTVELPWGWTAAGKMPTTLTERSATLTLLDRIKEAMYGLGWKSVEDVTQLVGLDGGDEVKQDSVYRALTRNKIEFQTQATATNKAGLWAYGIAINSVRAGNPR